MRRQAELKIAVSDLDVKIVSLVWKECRGCDIAGGRYCCDSCCGDDRYPSDLEAMKAGKDIALANKETLGDGRPYDYADGKGLSCADPAGRQ